MAIFTIKFLTTVDPGDAMAHAVSVVCPHAFFRKGYVSTDKEITSLMFPKIPEYPYIAQVTAGRTTGTPATPLGFDRRPSILQ